jgi:CysZ protein
MKNNPLLGAAYLLRGFGLIRQPGLRRYVVIPLIVNTVLFSALIGFWASRFNRIMEWLLPSGWAWLEWLLWPLFAVGAALVVFFGFTLLANLVGAPFNDRLSEAVESRLTGRPSPSENGIGGMLSGFGVSILSEAGKLVYWIGWSVPLLILFFVPVVNVVAPVIWMVFTAWMLAIEYLDYPMSRNGLSPVRQREILGSSRLTSLGFGSAVMVLTLIPFLNFLAMPTAVAGATALWVDQLSKDHSIR